jgi:hypothetical protein
MQFIKKLFTRFFLWSCEDFLIQRSNNMKDMFSNLDQHIVNRFAELEKTSWKIKTTKMFNDFKSEVAAQDSYYDCMFNDINSVIAQIEHKLTDMNKKIKTKSPQEILDKIESKSEIALAELQRRIVTLREMEKNIIAQTYSFQQVVNRLDKEKSKNDTTRKGNSPEAEG